MKFITIQHKENSLYSFLFGELDFFALTVPPITVSKDSERGKFPHSILERFHIQMAPYVGEFMIQPGSNPAYQASLLHYRVTTYKLQCCLYTGRFLYHLRSNKVAV